MSHSVSSIVMITCRGWSLLAVELVLDVDVFALAPCMCVDCIVDVVESSGDNSCRAVRLDIVLRLFSDYVLLVTIVVYNVVYFIRW
jgi:hypothetical protein